MNKEKIKNLFKNKKATLSVITFAVVVIMASLSYAYFSTMSDNSKRFGATLTAANLSLTFADGDNGINAALQFGESVTKKFTITNTGNNTASMSLDWKDLVNTYLDRSLSYELSYSDSPTGEYTVLSSGNMPTSNSPLTQTLEGEISVPVDTTYYYNLKIKLNDLPDIDQTVDMNATFYTYFQASQPIKYRYYTMYVDPALGEWENHTGIQQYELKNGETKSISNPIRVGYTFNGWEIKGSGYTQGGTTYTMGISDLTLTAKWIPNKHTLTINPDGGVYTGETSIEMDYDSSILLGNISREGYTFTGWTVSGGKYENGEFTLNEDKDASLTATWEINDYKYIVYHNKQNINGEGYTLVGADTYESEANYNSTVRPEVKTYTGFTSPAQKSLTIKAESIYPPVLNRVDYNYVRNKYNLTVNPNGGTYKGNTTNTIIENIYYDSQITLETPTRVGYSFGNWSVTGTGSSINENTLTMGTENATVTVSSWTANEYSVVFNENGGTTLSEENKSKLVTYDSTYGTLPTPSRAGYAFQSWWTAASGGTQVTNTTKVSITEPQTLYAHWNPKTGVLKDILLEKANAASVTNYKSGNKADMYTFSHEATEQTEELVDYRYIGSAPNNYVTFNDETWRIIGVFPVDNGSGTLEYRVKIMRNGSIGNIPWNSDGTNDWTKATLNTYLNGDYYNGLSESAKNQIVSSTWYLGAFNATKNNNGSILYGYERSNTVGRASGSVKSTTGKVGLIYPSDYVYTHANGVDSTGVCYNNPYDCDISAEKSNGWFYKDIFSKQTNWTLSPLSGYAGGAFFVDSGGRVSVYNYVTDSMGVSPAVYLKSDIKTTGGDGSEENPYTLEEPLV